MYMLCALADYIRNLLCCDGVCIALRCFDGALCHPQLRRVLAASDDYRAYYGSITNNSLLADERVRAACDMATQTRTVWYVNTFTAERDCAEPAEMAQTSLMVIVPLERPAGIVGVLLCTLTRTSAFGYGEYNLLQQYVDTVAKQVEEVLSRQPVIPAAMWCPTPPFDEYYSDVALDECALTEKVIRGQNELLSMVSHDLRIPLSVIKGYIGLLQVYGVAGCADLEPEPCDVAIPLAHQKRYLNVIMDQINHLEVLIGDLLDMSRIQSGRLKMSLVDVDLATLCRRVTQQMQDRIELQEPGRYIIQCVQEPDLVPVRADIDRVQQVLVNLLENAIKYSPEGGLIEVLIHAHRRSLPRILAGSTTSLTRCRREDCSAMAAYLSVTVRDHGIGIPLRQQAALFEPFKRLDNAITRQRAGHGLGLYITRLLVSAMNGRIALKSQEGKGTSITFTLPAIVGPASPHYGCVDASPLFFKLQESAPQI
jgi:signal transduction histidine kinase